MKGINAIRVIAKNSWGADQDLLTQLLCALVRSKMEYGSQVYSSARKSQLKKLDSVFSKGLRIVTGCFRTTPINALYRLANIPPMDIRRAQVAYRYGERVRAYPLHLVRNQICTPTRLQDFRKIPSRTCPLGVRLSNGRDELGISQHQLCNYKTPFFPPWMLSPSNIDLSILSYGKSMTNPDILLKLFKEKREKYRDWNFVYTDGSKTEQGVGCALVFDGFIQQYSLPECASIFTAELWAIEKAIIFIMAKQELRWIVCSDSASGIVAIQDTFSSDPSVITILDLLRRAGDEGKHIKLLWVPSHIGIEGNEAADVAARDAITSNVCKLPIRLDDQLRVVNKALKSSWEGRWQREQTQLAEVLPHVKPITWPQEFKRCDTSKLQRIASGHTRLTHSHLLVGGPRPRCPKCRTSVATIHHIVSECPMLQQERERHKITRPLSEMYETVEGIRSIKDFFISTGLYFTI